MKRANPLSPAEEASALLVRELWGFDPKQLLDSVEFPYDQIEREIGVSRVTRMHIIVNQPEITPKDMPMEFLTAADHTRYQREQDAMSQHLMDTAAAITIQSVARGWLVRRKLRDLFALLGVSANETGHSCADLTPFPLTHKTMYHQLVSFGSMKLQDRILRKYNRYCDFVERQGYLLPDFPYFVASWVQAVFKMFIARRSFRRFLQLRCAADVEGQEREARRLRSLAQSKLPRDKAVLPIQRAWRRFYQRRIYHFYRSLVNQHENIEPRHLMKYINPGEAQYIDPALSLHVRFRLAGTSFPPTIVYKIFTHKNMVDLNAFSPRNYAVGERRKLLPLQLFVRDAHLPKHIKPVLEPLSTASKEGWYNRLDNNAWRPISEGLMDAVSAAAVGVDIGGNLKPVRSVKYHYNRLKRRQDQEARQHQRKLEWLRKMYAAGRQGFDLSEDHTREGKGAGQKKGLVAAEEASAAHEEGDALIAWTKALNFEDYHLQWLGTAVSGGFSFEPFHPSTSHDLPNGLPDIYNGRDLLSPFQATMLSDITSVRDLYLTKADA